MSFQKVIAVVLLSSVWARTHPPPHTHTPTHQRVKWYFFFHNQVRHAFRGIIILGLYRINHFREQSGSRTTRIAYFGDNGS